MYLSRLILNPRNRQVQRELADPYQLHRTIMAAFPTELPDDERVLFRLDDDRGPLCLLVQSQHRPDWSHLGDPALHAYLQPNLHNPAVKAFEPRLTPGLVLAFRLRANPTVKRDGKRRGLYRAEEQRNWLARKAEAAGFRPLHAQMRHEGQQRTYIKRKGNTHRVELLAVRYDGILTVQDPDHLYAALRDGIGPAKGLGFGLLSLAPVPGLAQSP